MLISATIYSVLCLFVTGLFDLVLKLYSNKGYSLGKLIFGVGLIWGFLQWVNMEFNSKSLDFSAPTLFYGTCAAVSVTVSNILLLKSMEQLPISAVSTIYRLNTVPLVVLLIFFCMRKSPSSDSSELVSACSRYSYFIKAIQTKTD